jgi:hypothetical protein
VYRLFINIISKTKLITIYLYNYKVYRLFIKLIFKDEDIISKIVLLISRVQSDLVIEEEIIEVIK